ncbi:MAG: Ig-like domain-containing protein [Clostridia bacterium]|nr:Ig-like domain-containing protein [Clostridia bacterium]
MTKRILAFLTIAIMLTVFIAPSALAYQQAYYPSDWARPTFEMLGATAHEPLQRSVTRYEFAAVNNQIWQSSASRQGLHLYTGGSNNFSFSDINSVEPVHQSQIRTMSSRGLINGYPDGTFKPNQPVNRAEGAAIYRRVNSIFLNMGQAFSSNNYGGYYDYYNNNYNNYYSNYNFYDVPADHWAAPDIAIAASNNIIVGTAPGYFEPDGGLTVEQVVLIVVRYYGNAGVGYYDIKQALSSTFKISFRDMTKDGGTSIGGTKITSLTSNKTNINMNVNDYEEIRVTIYPSSASYKQLSWYSSNPSIVSVEETWSSGNYSYIRIRARNASYTPVKVVGTAMDGSNRSVTVNVTVNNYGSGGSGGLITRITPNQTTVYMKSGETRNISASIYPTNAYNKELYWYSANRNVVDVSDYYTSGSKGYAKLTAGYTQYEQRTTITVRASDASNIQENITVIVSPSGGNQGNVFIERITPNPSSAMGNQGEGQQVQLNILPYNATNKNIIWSSDNNAVATVNQNGYISFISQGSTYIRAVAQDGSGVATIIPVTVQASGGGVIPGTGSRPVVTIEGQSNGIARVFEETSFIITVSDPDFDITSFSIAKTDILHSPDIEIEKQPVRLNDKQYQVFVKGLAPGHYYLNVREGVAIDAAGNSSFESEGASIRFLSPEEYQLYQ